MCAAYRVQRILQLANEARIAEVVARIAEAGARAAAAEAAARSEVEGWKQYLKTVIFILMVKMAETPLKMTANDHRHLNSVDPETLKTFCKDILGSHNINGGVPPWFCWAPVKNTGAPLRVHKLVAIFAKIFFSENANSWPEFVSEELREACIRMIAAEPSDDDSLCSAEEFAYLSPSESESEDESESPFPDLFELNSEELPEVSDDFWTTVMESAPKRQRTI